jgi:hypothetical protein
MYYCHSIATVRLYDVEILDIKNKTKINQAIILCHMDTSSWVSTHVAFKLFGSSPGKTEVCHWIMQNNLSWMVLSDDVVGEDESMEGLLMLTETESKKGRNMS